MSRRRTIELTEATDLSSSVRGLVFDAVDGPFAYRAGQHVTLFVPTKTVPYKRPYSIASAPSALHPERFEIAVTRVDGGSASSGLHDLSVGTRIQMDGPSGTFVLARSDAPILFIATGSGLAPVRAMLQEELRDVSGPAVVLLFGCRTESDILWGGELRSLARERPRFRFEVTLSRQDARWAGRTGHVQKHTLELARGLGSPRAYVCGLSEMVGDVVTLLENDAALPRSHVRYETYS